MAELLIAVDDRVRTLTLNRPERRNALTPALQDALIAAFADAAADRHLRALVLTGAGECFCAGLDLAALEAMQGQSAVELNADSERIARMFRMLYELPVPTIAAVNGHAIAGGTGLATLCDFTYAVPTAKFAYTEVKIGFVPALVSAYLTLQVGEKRARELLLTGRIFTADEALRFGLVTDVVTPEALEEKVQQTLALLLANSPSSLRATKRLLIDSNRPWLDQALDAATATNASTRQTPDFSEGVRAFLEKRRPVWQD